jgi:hypothetical protein
MATTATKIGSEDYSRAGPANVYIAHKIVRLMFLGLFAVMEFKMASTGIGSILAGESRARQEDVLY